MHERNIIVCIVTTHLGWICAIIMHPYHCARETTLIHIAVKSHITWNGNVNCGIYDHCRSLLVSDISSCVKLIFFPFANTAEALQFATLTRCSPS